LQNQTLNHRLTGGDDQSRHFSTAHLRSDLGQRSTRGGAVTMVAQLLKFLITTVATIMLARLLTPQDYGLIGMVAIVVNFVGMFPFLGLSTATMRWSELNHQQVSTLFWINVGLSAGVALLAMACAPLLAFLYGEPRLIGIMMAYAVTLLLTGLYIQHEAILSRQMRFAAIAVIETGAMVAGFAAAIVSAWFGARYWALVVNQLVMTVVTIGGVWIACRWRPGLPMRGAGVRSMLSFGGNLTGFNVMTYFGRNLDNALIGKFWGPYQLGIYSRAYQMLLMPMQQINAPLAAVAVPALSRLTDAPERYRAAYLRMIEKVAMVTMPGVCFMIGTSDWLVLFLLGPQWTGAARIFTFLGIAAIVQPVTKTVLWLFTTQGRARELFRWGVVSSVLAMASIIVGLPWGATGVAAAYAVTDLCVSTPLLFWYVGRKGPVRTSDLYRIITPAAFASICSLVTLIICRPWLFLFGHLSLRLIIGLGITIVVSLVVFAALPAGRLAIQNSKEALILLLKRKRDFSTPALQ
jgi:PST family polysaccharide transporter